MTIVKLDDAVATVLEDAKTLRHDLHRHPEPGFEEKETQRRLRSVLESNGLAPRACAQTGLVVDIGRGDGPKIALRADIDCLRMTEENPDLPYRSERPGLAHMCGHDGHTATLAATATLLAGVGAELPGTVRLLFQPAEEGPGGAPLMIEDGALDDVAEVYGMHNWPGLPLGQLRTIVGPCMATVAEFTIEVRGKGGHASMPHLNVDPVLAASHVVSALQSIVSRNVYSGDQTVLTVSSFHAGEAFNVIPDTAKLGGTVRALDEDAYALIERRIPEVATMTSAAFGCTAQVKVHRMYPVLVNTPAETAHVERVAAAVFGAPSVATDLLPMLGAEDFAYYLRETPGCFFFLGGGEPGRANALCHSTNFDYNDNLLEPGIRFWIRLVEDRLGCKLYD